MLFGVGFHHWSSETSEESRGHVKGNNAGHVMGKNRKKVSDALVCTDTIAIIINETF